MITSIIVMYQAGNSIARIARSLFESVWISPNQDKSNAPTKLVSVIWISLYQVQYSLCFSTGVVPCVVRWIGIWWTIDTIWWIKWFVDNIQIRAFWLEVSAFDERKFQGSFQDLLILSEECIQMLLFLYWLLFVDPFFGTFEKSDFVGLFVKNDQIPPFTGDEVIFLFRVFSRFSLDFRCFKGGWTILDGPSKLFLFVGAKFIATDQHDSLTVASSFSS